MKAILIALLACLLLCGCGGQGMDATSPTEAAAAVTPTEPAGNYLPGSEMETATSGAVRAYALALNPIWDIRAVGEDVLVFSGEDVTTITRLTGENLFRVAEVTLDQFVPVWSPSLHVSENWVIYYDEATRELVCLDEDLQEFYRISMPEDIQGYPVITRDRQQVYYCAADGLRRLEVESGISRLVKEMTFAIQSVADILLDGTVLTVCVSDGVSNTETLFLDAQTGALCYGLYEDMQLKAGTEYCYAIDTEGVVEQMIFGNAEEIRQLTPRDYLTSGEFLPESHAAVVYHRQEEMLTLDYYDLGSGKRTATLNAGDLTPHCLTSDGENFVYFLSNTDDVSLLYRWDISRTPAADERSYVGTRYTLTAPDEDGLQACTLRAQQLSEKYGLDIRIGEDATAVMPWDYGLVAEYQVNVIVDALDELDQMLSAFPTGFLETAMSGFEEGELTLCLVRSLVGSHESGSLETTEGIQFWEGNHAYVAVALGETFEKTFYHQLFHVLESRILSETIAYYRWDELNPKGFAYDNDYLKNQSRNGSKYLEDATRSFIDTYSMSFEKEDRARVFAYACMDGNESFFQSQTMQKKLKTLCIGLREAYNLENCMEPLRWEQYLEKSLAP